MGLLCNEKVENLLNSNSTVMDLPKYPSSSTKRAHCDDQDQNLQENSEPLDCPRCGSRNTKFCYYNNYNKSQPRHFCKACKRHWTKGGTLRNVPVGGCRKNKRLKTSGGGSEKSAAAAAVADTVAVLNTSMMYDQDCHDLYLGDQEVLKAFNEDDQKSISSLLFDAFMENNSNRNFSFSGIDSLPFDVDGGGGNQPSSISGIQDKLHNVYNYDHCSNNSQLESLESSSITTVNQNNDVFHPPWKSGGMAAEAEAEMADYWNLNDLDALISADINVPWDDDDDDGDINP